MGCTHLKEKGESIIWGPDRFLGNYIQKETGADMLMWQGACIVHEEFRATGLEKLKKDHPDTEVLVHPESPEGVIAIKYVGLRPGEKLFEELLIGSNVMGTRHPRILRADEDFLPFEVVWILESEIVIIFIYMIIKASFFIPEYFVNHFRTGSPVDLPFFCLLCQS